MKKKVKIAVIAPPFNEVPPQGQGGTERVAYYMIEGLVKRGYDVTLFGTGKCQTSARFVQIFKKAISKRKFDTTYLEASRALRLETLYIARIIQELQKKQNQFDVVFNHLRGGFLFLSAEKLFKAPIVSVLHLPVFPELAEFLKSFKKTNFVTVSNNQRKGLNKINFLDTVYNGVNTELFKFNEKPKDYFLFMGAMGEHKNPREAILACKKAKVKLILAGGKKREPYFSKQILPLVDGKQIKYVGEVSGSKRIELFKYAKAFLFPTKFPEPFGLVAIESMAGGTPVIGYPAGAIPEVVKDKQTGFIVKNVSQMTEAIKKIGQIDRKKCRERAEYFSVEKMVDSYEVIVKKLTTNN